MYPQTIDAAVTPCCRYSVEHLRQLIAHSGSTAQSVQHSELRALLISRKHLALGFIPFRFRTIIPHRLQRATLLSADKEYNHIFNLCDDAYLVG
jgi:hypothetical protein